MPIDDAHDGSFRSKGKGETVKLNWGGWLYGLVSGFIGGGASAITSSIVLPSVDAKDFNFGGGLHSLLLVAGALFLVHGGMTAAAYLSKSPLPAAREVWTDEQRAAAKQEPPKP
jgi:hypothetical protein